MKNQFILLLPFILLAQFVPSLVRSDDKRSEDVPELVQLEFLVGTFKTNVEFPVKTIGNATGEWIHDGRFLKHAWTRQANKTTPAINGTIIVTYDVLKKKYRQWSFDSTGTIFESDGVWSPKSQTMTWTGSNAGFSHRWTQTVDKNGAHNWAIVVKNPNGDVVYETRGKTTRAKNESDSENK